MPVITGVGLDHTAVLGSTLEEIAAEKAGIRSGDEILSINNLVPRDGLDYLFAVAAARLVFRLRREGAKRVVRIAREHNREIATPAQAREMLGLSPTPRAY